MSSPPRAVAPQDDATRKMLDGFSIDWMNLSDAKTNERFWHDDKWDDLLVDKEIHIPARILRCHTVAREFQFSSVEMLAELRIQQRVFYHDHCLEEWNFEFGFVIPNSTNTWQQTIESAGEGNMLPASALNGNVVIETAFYDGEVLICKSVLRVFYDA